MIPSGDIGAAFGHKVVLRGDGADIADLMTRHDGQGFWSTWQLNEDERAAIADGADVLLYILGVVFPPVSLRVAGVMDAALGD